MKSFLYGVLYTTILASFFSCGSTRHLQYMQGSFDTSQLNSYQTPTPVIQKGDLLGIVVYSDNPAATAIYNQSVTTSTAIGSASASTQTSGYLVDENGDIIFQGIGRLHVEGLTKTGLNQLLASKLKDYLQNAYFNIRFLNYKITIIGDVARPSLYTIPAERVNILEAIGLAGDLNITARRENILVIRETNGKREFGRIDLTRTDIFTSPYYQLQQNDVVVVDFNKSKAAASDQTTVRNISIATSIGSTSAIILTVFTR